MVTALFQPSTDEKGEVDDKSKVKEGEEEEESPPPRGSMPATKLEGNERELLLKLMIAEAGGEGKLGMAAVARSVLNRAGLIQSGKVTPDTFNAKSGSIFDVISAPDQYTPYNNGLPSITEDERRRAIRALAMAENTAGLRATLEGKSMSASDINNIMKSTGFRTHSAGYDRSQDVNPTTLGGHIFNTAGNTGMVSPTASISQAQIAGSAVSRAGQTTGTQKGDMISGFPVRSPYGNRTHPVTGERNKPHGGIDIGTPVGTFVALSVPVEIMYAASNGNYGYVIDAWAPSLGLQFRLAHLKEFLVRKGQKVPAGTALGRTGGAKGDRGAGMSTGPHLHFEVDNKKNGTTYGGLGNPSPYVQYLILSSNGPRAGASVTTPGAVTSSRARSISGLASYEQGAENTIYVPSQQQQQTVVAGGGSSPVLMAASTRDVVNSYYKQQLLGFLYKQG
jgi:murein DD-endopeptidase MepM/ murein hydrolase activator NlpD